MLKRIANRLPLTRIKIALARSLYSATVPFVGKGRKRITRGGIHFEVDPSEGIDLSLYLFGGFQKHVTANQHLRIPKDAVILDVGANVGIMTLRFAQAAPQGVVHAFEPTHHALGRMKVNLSLNPELAARVHVYNTFVSDRATDVADIKAYASWKVDGSKPANGELHPVHLGTALGTEGVGSLRLDDFVAQQKLARVDLIKIDTDGHEYEVLNGAHALLAKYKPTVIFEVGRYVMKEKGFDFDHYLQLFGKAGYKLYDAPSGKEVTAANYARIIPEQGTTDVVAVPVR